MLTNGDQIHTTEIKYICSPDNLMLANSQASDNVDLHKYNMHVKPIHEINIYETYINGLVLQVLNLF